MADKFKFVPTAPTRLLYSSITQKSAPKSIAGAEPKFSGTFGLEEPDFKAIIPVMVQAIQSETGGFSGNPNEYYLACMSGAQSANRVMQKAELDAQALRGKGDNDGAFKLLEKATKRADLYKQFAGILSAASKFDIELAKLAGGAIVDIVGEAARAKSGQELFYSGAYVVPSIAIQGFRRKKLDDRDGCTAFLQNVLFIRNGEKLSSGGAPSNSEVFGGYVNYSSQDPYANAPGADDAWSGTGNGQAGANQSQGAGSSAGGNGQGQNNGGQTGYTPSGGYQNNGGQTNEAPQW